MVKKIIVINLASSVAFHICSEYFSCVGFGRRDGDEKRPIIARASKIRVQNSMRLSRRTMKQHDKYTGVTPIAAAADLYRDVDGGGADCGCFKPCLSGIQELIANEVSPATGERRYLTVLVKCMPLSGGTG